MAGAAAGVALANVLSARPARLLRGLMVLVAASWSTTSQRARGGRAGETNECVHRAST